MSEDLRRLHKEHARAEIVAEAVEALVIRHTSCPDIEEALQALGEEAESGDPVAQTLLQSYRDRWSRVGTLAFEIAVCEHGQR